MRFAKTMLTCVIFLFTIMTGADEQVPGFKDVLNLYTPYSVSMSPDGSKVLYQLSKADWDENDYDRQIYMYDVELKESRQLTFNEKNCWAATWSPDGKYISFLSSRDEKTQVYLMYVGGGEAKAVTKSETGVNAYSWSNDSSKIAFTSSDDMSEKNKKQEEEFGKFEVFEGYFNNSDLWILDLQSKDEKKVIESDGFTINDFSWSPDDSTIAVVVQPDPRIKQFINQDIKLFDVENGELSDLITLKGSDASPVWSPDGKKIAFTTGMGEASFFKNTNIATVELDTGEVVNITDKFDEDPGLYYWNNSGIIFTAFQGMQRHIFRISDSGEISQISEGEGRIYSSLSYSKDESKMVFAYYDANNYTELYLCDTEAFEPVKITEFSKQIEDWNLAVKEPVSWKSSDDAEITGVLIKPADFDPNKKYPLMVIIHGGPTGISIPSRFDRYNAYYPIEQWVAKGAVVLEPNYRGSAGFGEDFRSLNYRNLGVGDYWDVLSGVDYLIEQGFVDKDRVCSMGWSQGGYISAFITTYSDRFLATSVGAGISDWVDYYYRTDITNFCPMYLGDDPWDDPEVYKKTSPMTYIKNAKTPTLIQHGENDARVPINNAYKLHRGLEDQGVEVKFIIYQGFGHGITRPKEKLAVITHNWEWFNKHVWGEEPASDAKKEPEEK